MVYQKQILLETRGHRHLHDVTADVARIVHDSGVRTGTAHVFNVGSTGALGAIEYEPGLLEDLPDLLDKLIPPGRDYGHEQAWHDGNGHSHLQATLLGPSLTVPVADRKDVYKRQALGRQRNLHRRQLGLESLPRLSDGATN